MVLSGLVTAWRLAGWPIRRSPSLVKATIDGVVRAPSEFSMTLGLPPSMTATQELVVPRSIPMHLVPSSMLNAFAVGRRGDSAIAVTDGLIRSLTLRELAGVLAHEVSHIAHEDLRVMAFADMVARYTSFMSTFGIFTLFINIGFVAGGYEVQVPWLAVLVLVLSPTIGSLLQLALSRTREFDADLGAAMLTGDPDGLASALIKLDRAQARHWEAMMLPGGRIPDPSILRTHPATPERVARLMALKDHPDGAQVPIFASTGHPRTARGPSVPSVPRSFGPRADADIRRLARLLNGSSIGSLHVDGAGENPAGHEGLCEPEGLPRIRIRRGGVWW
jgi:heat shock protein HtpX